MITCNDSTSRPLICVNCGAEAVKLYTKYDDKDVIKLENCKSCGKAVDKYVEFDPVLIYIDLLLQYIAAYRHLFINLSCESYWRIVVVFTMFSAYNKWTQERSYQQLDLALIYELEWQFYKSLLESGAEILAYSAAVLVATLLQGCEIRDHKHFMCTSMCGFYGNSLMVFSIIWKLHDQWPVKVAIHGFLTISHFNIQRVLCHDRGKLLALVTVLIGTAVQLACGHIAKRLIQHLS